MIEVRARVTCSMCGAVEETWMALNAATRLPVIELPRRWRLVSPVAPGPRQPRCPACLLDEEHLR